MATNSAFLLFTLASLLSLATAQTWTSCNPLNRTDCPSMTALGTNYTINCNDTRADTSIWNNTAGAISYINDGARFAVDQRGLSPTLTSNFYIFFGKVSVIMKAARGQGVVSSIVLQSDLLDEMDWEWIGGNETHVQSNYFGKGNTTSYDRAVWHPISSPQDTYHNYTYQWTSSAIEWWINDQLIRTLHYADANGGHNFPQSPCFVRLGVWAGGDPKNDNYTIGWAGGLVDYAAGPYTMVVQSLYVEDFTSGSKYEYGDTSGSWQSIKVTEGESSTMKEIWSPKGVSGHWNVLPKAAQIAIVACSIGVAAVLAALMAFCCVRQRKAGRKEKAVADAMYEKDARELMEFRQGNAKKQFRVELSRVPSAPSRPGRMF